VTDIIFDSNESEKDVDQQIEIGDSGASVMTMIVSEETSVGKRNGM
jgi:hypothetical protein